MQRIAWIALVLLIAGGAFADDGAMFRRNVSNTPDLETEHTYVKMMKFYVPAQASSGELTPIEYYDAEGALVDTRAFAKPLVSFYQDGEVEHVPDVGFSGHGQRDTFAALSLDDGTTWKRKNLSKSGDQSSFRLRDGTEYPGDVVRIGAATYGNRVLVAWSSRYCRGGSPAYALDDEEKALLVAFLGLGEYDLYLTDLFGVTGAQGSSDFADEGYPEVGEVPYTCMWSARGTLETDPNTGLRELVWRKAERLTSGRRDTNRVEVAAAGAGFLVTWQEDPDGLRPGEGEGPGEGWSGAIAHQGTDVWYSYVNTDHFGLVYVAGGDPIPYELYTGDEIPKPGVPMAVPVRLTDNAKCAPPEDPAEVNYCNFAVASLYGLPDYCVDTIDVMVGPDDTDPSQLCVTADGRVLIGNTASTRARFNLRPYTRADGTASAWVVIAYEEKKGLGDFFFDSNGNPCQDGDEDCEVVDEGKNIWYHSFDMFSLELVSHGNILNQPAVDPTTGEFFPLLSTADLWGFGEYDYPFYETEIARRFGLISQAASKAGDSGLVGFAMFKQGIIKQGGPADILVRRFLVPEDFDPAVDNPFAFENMECDTWAFADGSHPYYRGGVCLDPPINVSATHAVTCEGGDCPPVTGDSTTGVDPAEPADFVDVLTWEQTPENLDDLTWENPFDLAKGHRGFIDGDFIMQMYAWSPNWKKNAVGHDNYNLYVRRSFDGGQTWTTLPAAYTHVDGSIWGGDGTTTCENYRDETVGDDGQVCYDYGPGEFEQARNLSQLVSMQLTVLDPRFTPVSGSIVDPDTGGFLYPDDACDPSKFFATFETGDNTTVAEGEAEPLDMFYSRAYDWGDDYALVDTDDDGVEDFFDWLENHHDDHASEASVTANPGGNFFYAIWQQWQEDETGVSESDAMFRRIMYLEDDGTSRGIFGDSFESGDLSGWTLVVAP